MKRVSVASLLPISLIVVCIVFCVGCEKAASSPVAASPEPAVVVSQSKPAAVVATEPEAPIEKIAPTAKEAGGGHVVEIPLKVASWEQTQAIVAGHKGKIVVLDLWSTYCPPCLKELPELAKIHRQHGGDVVCLSFNCNYAGDGSPEAEREAILKALKECGATFQNLISSDADENLYKKVGIASIPVVQVYDRTGKLSKQFDNEKDEYGKDGFTYAQHITPYVEQLAKDAAK